MRNIVTAQQIYPALKALLGLPELCTKFELRAGVNDIVTVTCEHYVSLDASGLKQLQAVLSDYELVSRMPAVDSSSAQAVGFDAWMRRRTERAHAEYMAGHAAGGIAYT